MPAKFSRYTVLCGYGLSICGVNNFQWSPLNNDDPAWLKNGPWNPRTGDAIEQNWPIHCQPSAFYTQARTWPSHFHTLGEPAHFPLWPCPTLSTHMESFSQGYRTKDVNHWHFHYVLKGNRHVFHVELVYCTCIANSCIWSEVWLGAFPTNVSRVT